MLLSPFTVSRTIAVLTVFLVVASEPARADLHFAQPHADAGDVRSGPVLSQHFAFVNRGPGPIQFTGAQTSCGCLTPRLPQGIFQPGQEGSIQLEVHTLSQAAGPNTWRLHVAYRTEAAVNETTLQLSARLISEITVEPAAMTVFAGRALTHTITIRDRREKPLAITAVRGSSPRLKVQLGDPDRDEQGCWMRKLQVEIAGDCPEGRHEESIGIYNDDPDYRELKVPVTIVKRPRQRLTALPNAVTLLAPAGQAVPSRIVLIRDSENQEVIVASVTADDPAIVCQWARGPNAMSTLKVSVDRARLHGSSLQSAVHVRVSQPIEQTLTIPISCTAP